MKKLNQLMAVVLLVGSVACQSVPSPGNQGQVPMPPPPESSAHDNLPGAPTPAAAIDRFFAAVRSQDLQALGMAWGTTRGPALNAMGEEEFEKRALILICYFNHNSYTIGAESRGTDGQRVFRVKVSKGARTANPAVTTVLGPRGRWYVQDLEMAAVRDFCSQ